MTRSILCKKLNEEAEGLNAPPYPGELGQKIYNEISKPAWQQWLKRQTMVINEYRLNVREPQSRKILEKEMVNFLFGNSDEGQN